MRNKKPKILNIYKIDKNRKRPSFLIARFLSKIIIRKPKYRFLGEEFPKDEPIVFLSNHVGKKAPSKLELYWKRDFRMWGTHEITEGFKSIHHYLVHIYYHQKKHIPLFFSWFIGTIAAMYITPLYRGFRIIPTYHDHRFLISMKLSLESFKLGRDLIIFPEDSSEGYKQEITSFYGGFASLLKNLDKRGMDALIYLAFFKKKENTFIVSKGIRYSEIKDLYPETESLAEEMRKRLNELNKK